MEAMTARQQFDADGFYIARNLLDAGVVDVCAQDIHAVFAQQVALLGLPDAGDLFGNARALHGAHIEQFKKVLAALWRLQSVGALLNAAPIMAVLKKVFGFGPVFVPGGQTVHVQSAELKIPGGYFGLKAHQDWPSVQGSLDGLGVWVALCAIDANAYPLEVVPGSHRRGLIAPAGNQTSGLWVVDALDDAAFVPVCVKPGDVVFFSNFLVHRSGLAGRSDFVRIACSTRFDNGGEPSFVARGLPSAYTRAVQRELMDFADVDAVNRSLPGGIAD